MQNASTFGMLSILLRDIDERNGFLLVYLFGPLFFLIVSLLVANFNLFFALCYVISNVLCLYVQAKDKYYLLVFLKCIPPISFLILLFIIDEVLFAYKLSFILPLLITFYYIYSERHMRISVNEYFKKIYHGFCLGMGFVFQGAASYLEKYLVAILFPIYGVLYLFFLDLFTLLKGFTNSFIREWQILFYKNENVQRKKYFIKIITANIIFFFPLFIIVLIKTNYYIYFLLLFTMSVFVLGNTWKEFEYFYYVKSKFSTALLFNISLFAFTIVMYLLAFFTPFKIIIFISRSLSFFGTILLCKIIYNHSIKG